MRVVLSRRAEIELEEIGDHIAADSPARAVSFVQELREHFDRIAKAPLAYVERLELGEGVRSCAHGNCLILFIPKDREVLVVWVVQEQNIPEGRPNRKPVPTRKVLDALLFKNLEIGSTDITSRDRTTETQTGCRRSGFGRRKSAAAET